jgi:hypothetical protein
MQHLARMNGPRPGNKRKANCHSHCNSAGCLDDSDCRCRGTLRGVGRLMCALSAAMAAACVYILVH